MKNIKISDQVNNLFSVNNNIKTIKKIELPEYTSFYSPDYKFPLAILENLKKSLKTKITFVRAIIEDPFRPYEDLPLEEQFTSEDYQEMKKIGLSPGHLAAAGLHKSSMEAWNSTFYYINMVPQDIVLNAGIWMLLETFSKNVANNPFVKKFYCLSGVIPDYDQNVKLINGTVINKPKFCYKIFITKTANNMRNNNISIVAFLIPNVNLQPEGEALKLNKYLIDFDKLNAISGLNFYDIVEYIIKRNNMLIFQNKTKKQLSKKKTSSPSINFISLQDELTYGIKLNIKGFLEKSIKNAVWFGKIVNSETLDELEENWKQYQKLNEEEKLNRSLEYHKEYYDLAKDRILNNDVAVYIKL